MMTSREKINNQLKQYFYISVSGLFLFIAGTVLWLASIDFNWVFELLGVLLALYGASCIYTKVKCPSCLKPLGAALGFQQNGLPNSISTELRYCPHCGDDYDKEA